MKLFDLEEFIKSKIEENGELDSHIIKDAIKFKVVLHDFIIPPIEGIDLLCNRELVLVDNHLYCQETLDHPVLFDKILKETSQNDDGLENEPVESVVQEEKGLKPAGGLQVEYEHIGTIPEGVFLFKEYFPVIHVDNNGAIKQLDLMKLKNEIKGIAVENRPMNKEFNNILVEDYKEHEWDEIAQHFVHQGEK